MPGDLQKTKIVFELAFVPTEGTRLPIVTSGNFGRLPFSGQLSDKHVPGRIRTLD